MQARSAAGAEVKDGVSVIKGLTSLQCRGRWGGGLREYLCIIRTRRNFLSPAVSFSFCKKETESQCEKRTCFQDVSCLDRVSMRAHGWVTLSAAFF